MKRDEKERTSDAQSPEHERLRKEHGDSCTCPTCEYAFFTPEGRRTETAKPRRKCPITCTCLCHATDGGVHDHEGRPCPGKLAETALRLDMTVPDTTRLRGLVAELAEEIDKVVRGISPGAPHTSEGVEQTPDAVHSFACVDPKSREAHLRSVLWDILGGLGAESVESAAQRVVRDRDVLKEQLASKYVWADEASPFTGAQVKDLLDENERLRRPTARVEPVPAWKCDHSTKEITPDGKYCNACTRERDENAMRLKATPTDARFYECAARFRERHPTPDINDLWWFASTVIEEDMLDVGAGRESPTAGVVALNLKIADYHDRALDRLGNKTLSQGERFQAEGEYAALTFVRRWLREARLTPDTADCASPTKEEP